jgi:hypothetical protein
LDTFNELRSSALFPNCLVPFYEYFYNTYVSSVNAKFPISLWNYHNFIENSIPRTNNGIEGWHSILKKSFGASRFSFPVLLSKLKNEDDASRLKHLQL